jgi:hypothetical protein
LSAFICENARRPCFDRLGALVLIALLFATIVAFVTGMSGPASSWAAKLPEGVPRLQEHLSFPRAPIDAVLLRFSPTAHTPVTPRDSHLIAAMEKRQLHLQESLVRIRTFGTIFRILYPYSVTTRYPPQNHPDWHDQHNDQYNY